MKLNIVDRLVGALDPVRGAQRAKARAQLAAFEGASAVMHGGPGGGYTSTSGADPFLRRWAAVPRSAEADTLRHLPGLRAQSRDLARNNPIAASAINTAVMRAIGTGLAYSAQPHIATLGWSEAQAEDWRGEVQAEFSLYADSKDCSWDGDGNFYEQQALALRTVLESGDGFTVLPDGKRTATMPYALRLQLLEADRVGNPFGKPDDPNVCGGIRRVQGRVQSVHIYHRHPGGVLRTGNAYAGEWVDVIGSSGRRRVLHHFIKLRPEQPRGVPHLAPVMGLFKLIGDYTDAEVKAAVISAFLTVFIETESGAGPAPVFGLEDTASGRPAVAGQGAASGFAADEVALGPAAIIGLAKGEKANVVNPGRPNPAFGPFLDAVLDQLGAGTFMGREMLMKRYSTSYVAARAAFLDAWTWLRSIRAMVALSHSQPILETWMAEAVALGRVRAPGFFADPRLRWAYTRAGWHGDSQGSINPKDEVAAYVAARDARLISNERAEWELFGTDWQAGYSTKLSEHRKMERDGMLPVPKAGAAAPQAGAAPADPADPEENPATDTPHQQGAEITP